MNATRPCRAGPQGTASVRKALVADLAAASAALAGWPQLDEATVHDTRKRLKRARALLALLHPALTGEDFRACDRTLREAGRSLAAARDAAVMTQLYAKLSRRGTTAPLRRPRLALPATSTQRPATKPARAHEQLQVAVRRLAQATLAGRGWTPLGIGLSKVYRRGRRRLPKSAEGVTSEALHAWRRHTKRWWHVLELFEAVAPARLAPAIAAARELSDVLGDDHDLVLLATAIRARRGRPQADDVAVLRRIDQKRDKLRRRALKLGADVYADRPKDVERRMRADWVRWRAAAAR